MKRTTKFLVGTMFLGSWLTNVCAQQTPIPDIAQVSFPKDTIRITDFGAVADGVTLNTKSINDAIAACSKKGGGVVVIPAGLWLTGPVGLQSNVNLHLESNALLQFSSDFDQYELVESNWEGLPAVRNQSPIWGNDLENIAITGEGVIDGAGNAWRMVKKDKLTESQWKTLVASGGVLSDDKKSWYPSAKSLAGSKMKNAGVLTGGKTIKDWEAVKDFFRPNLLALKNCKKVLLEGVSFQNSPAWCLHPLLCEDLTVRGIYVKNEWYAQNGDGIDIESCNRVMVVHSTFDVGDDGICLKSGRDEEGRKRGMPTQNVLIENCIVYHAHGGVVIGSEMSGGVKNVYVGNCTFSGTDIGLRFKTTRGRGGIVENIYITDINMKDIAGDAIRFDMYYAAKDPVPLAGEERDMPEIALEPVTDATPQFRNFYIKNIVCKGAGKAIFMRGLPEMNIRNIVLEDLTMEATTGIELTEATNILIKNLHLVTTQSDPLVYLQNSQQVVFDTLRYNPATVLFNIQGDRCKGIKLLHSDAKLAQQQAVYKHGATKQALDIK